jgi:Uma2 family endonuclease
MIRKKGDRTPPELFDSGDRLSREEFHRLYEATPQVKKAELVRGVVYVPSPTRIRLHATPHGNMITWLGVYQASTPGVVMGDNATVILNDDSEVQPDGLLMIAGAEGQTRITDDDYIAGGPELIVEVAASSASYDLHDKLDLYREARVKEYIIWRVRNNQIDWFVLRDDRYGPLSADADGVLRSEVFPGLWLNSPAMLELNLQQALKTLFQGLASSEHAAFVERLRQGTI